MDSFHSILKEYWGYDEFRPLQEDIIKSVYEGRDTLGLMPTGGGKSLTFQVPAMLMDGICLVVTPLIALMKDQVDNLRSLGIRAAYVHSGMSWQEIAVTLENCVNGPYKFLYVSPERLTTDLFLAKLPLMNVSMLVVDESHCISQWGYDFRPSYLRIVEIREMLPGIPVLALTATATPDVIDDIQDKLHFREKNVFKTSFERENLVYVVRNTDDKLYEIIHILTHVGGSAIVYVRSRKRTSEIAKALKEQGIDADFFHAGLNSDEKMNKQNAWKNDRCRVMVCTNAFGMGIDKPDVRVVIHFELPNSLEEYFQEAGRAGRDGKKSYAVALHSPRDAAQLKKRIKDEFPDKEFVKDVYEKLAYFFQIPVNEGIDTGHNFRIEKFCRAYRYNMTQAHSALKILDLTGCISYVEETDKSSKLLFTVDRDALYRLSAYDEKTENLIRILLRSYTGLFADYVHIDEDLLARRAEMSAHEVYETLKMLSVQQVIHYIPAQKVPTIYYNFNRVETRLLTIPKQVYEKRLERLENRIDSVIDYGGSQTRCRSRILLRYFGEKNTKNCGKCDVCLANKGRDASESELELLVRQILELLSQHERTTEELAAETEYPEKQIIEIVRFLADSGQATVENGRIKKV
ncbi:MAG: RecQ family ATP-dependent DNA helicase [Dysgonamonadaceae bacterium]|jgi:ATP-dependent DNA helicase RecQ|nr:RecQ family ATP-dependent DNA helicase [Dysgonamonadaceae bacterium]